jgi:hypothetical protein
VQKLLEHGILQAFPLNRSKEQEFEKRWNRLTKNSYIVYLREQVELFEKTLQISLTLVFVERKLPYVLHPRIDWYCARRWIDDGSGRCLA